MLEPTPRVLPKRDRRLLASTALRDKYTAAEIANATGLREDQVVHRLRLGLGAAIVVGAFAENSISCCRLPPAL